ncbi:MAG: hypothetical protein MAG715_00734 [Methanonatronarchaeales archaeon]|nr:hypothetical protein [Methanonatronarchaeales archaeon]
MKLAFVGKGGVGKTTLAGTVARLLGRRGYRVLAVDADPDMNLHSALGVEGVEPVTEHEELIEERAGGQRGVYSLTPKVDDVAERFAVPGPDDTSLLVVGTVEAGGAGCMCPAGSFLKALLRDLIVKREEAVVLDMEAGIEHLGRASARNVDVMVAVVEPGSRSIETAERVRRLAGDIGVERIVAVVNRADEGSIDAVRERLDGVGLDVAGVVPRDDSLVKADLENVPPVEVRGPAVDAIEELVDALEGMLGEE